MKKRALIHSLLREMTSIMLLVATIELLRVSDNEPSTLVIVAGLFAYLVINMLYDAYYCYTQRESRKAS